MRKEHVIELATGQIAYPNAHTTAGRLAYIGLYRQIGHREWEKRFLHVYIGPELSYRQTPKDVLIKYGFWEEHRALVNESKQRAIALLKEEIAGYESDRKTVKYSDHLIADHIEKLQDEIKELKRTMI